MINDLIFNYMSLKKISISEGSQPLSSTLFSENDHR